jgi:hypothetical protein
MTNLTWRYADSFAYMEHTRAGFPPAMICVAVNGGIQGTHPALPETPDEIADSVAAAYEAGASMVHVHARDSRDFTRGARRVDEWQGGDRDLPHGRRVGDPRPAEGAAAAVGARDGGRRVHPVHLRRPEIS